MAENGSKATDGDSGDGESGPKYYVRYIPASKVLQTKAPLIDKNLNTVFKKADDELDMMRADYMVWVNDDIKRLEAAYRNLAAYPNSKSAIDEVYKISYDMKGQGGTFGYQLVSFVMNNLCRYLDEREKLTASQLEVVELHVSSVKQIINHGLTEKGGEMGKQVILELQQMIAEKG